MGGKSSSAPPPDPRLVAAQIKSMGIQDSQIQQYVDLQSQLTPIQMEQMQKGIIRDDKQSDFMMRYNEASLQSQSAAAAGANAAAMANAGANGMAAAANSRLADSSIKMNDYQYSQMQERDKRWREVGIPQENALIAKVDEMGSEKYRDQQMGMAVGDINQGYSDSREQTLRGLGRMGMNGSSGQIASMMARGNADQALALAGTKNKMRMALTNTDLANKFQLNGAMKGMAGMGDMSANLAIGAIGAGKQSYTGGGGGGGGGFGAMGFGGGGGGGGRGGDFSPSGILSSYKDGVGMAGSMGSNASGMYSAMGSYKNGQDQIAASNNPWNTILGAGAGAAMKFGLGKIF